MIQDVLALSLLSKESEMNEGLLKDILLMGSYSYGYRNLEIE